MDSGISDIINYTIALGGLSAANRPLHLRLAFPGGTSERTLLPQRLQGREAICGGFEHQVLCVTDNASLALKDFIGLPAEVQIVTDQGELRRLCGIVTEAGAGESDGGLATYRLVLRDALSVMEKRRNTRIFRDKNELDIVMLLVAEWRQRNDVLRACFDVAIDAALGERGLPKRAFTMQHNESDAAFIRRLFRRSGIAWYFRPGLPDRGAPVELQRSDVPSHTLAIFADSLRLPQNAAGTVRYHRDSATEEHDAVNGLCAIRTLQPASASLHSWDYDYPAARGFMTTNAAGTADQGVRGNRLAAILDDHAVTAPHIGDGAADLTRMGELHMARHDYATKCFRGEGGVRALAVGEWIRIDGHPELDTHSPTERQFVITAQQIVTQNNLPVEFRARVERLFSHSGWAFDPHVPERKTASRPQRLKYVAGAIVVLLLLIPAWIIFEVGVLGVESETTMDKLRWIGLPIVIVGFVFGSSWVTTSRDADAREKAWKEKTEQLKREQAASKSEQAQRKYVLEVISLGVTVEKYRQQKLWKVLQTGTPYSTIREQDPRKYEWLGLDKGGVSGARACDALENAMGQVPMYWGFPSFYAGPPILDPDLQPGPANPIGGLAEGAITTGLAWHLFVTAPWQLAERPDQLLEQVFAFFDDHPDVPFVVLLSDDSLETRNNTRPMDAPDLLPDGYYVPEMPDSTTVIVLARRERAEPLRPFVWEDPDNDYLQETLRRAYFALQDTVPTPERLANPGKVIPIGRQPTVAEWLATADAFGKRTRSDASDVAPFLGYFNRWAAQPPKNWKPTPWFPVPWNRNQLATFDNLPTLGFIHRPVFVRFEDEHGNPVTRRDQRQKLLEEGWQRALQTLPEAERAKGPARIIGAFGNHTDQRIAFEGMLHRYAEQGGPEIDTGNMAQFIGTDHRIGNMGAATFFVQMALGVMGSYNAGGTSAAVNMRETDGASIVFISPPPDDKRKQQGDQFHHNVEPDIDPRNYGIPYPGAASTTQSN